MCDDAYFFFQAEDGIRDGRVTGVQTCALPIWSALRAGWTAFALIESAAMKIANSLKSLKKRDKNCRIVRRKGRVRSEERRVGKECRSRWWGCHVNKKS